MRLGALYEPLDTEWMARQRVMQGRRDKHCACSAGSAHPALDLLRMLVNRLINNVAVEYGRNCCF